MLDPHVGAGVTLRSLFADWPPDRLAQIYSEPRSPDRSAAGAYFLLNHGEPRGVPFVVRHVTRFLRFAWARGETGTLFFARVTGRLERWLDEVRPEVVFSQLGGLTMGQLTMAIARKRRLPLIVHMSDDWVNDWPANTLGRSIFPLTHLANRATRSVVRAAMREAAAVTVISWDMAEEYEHRYGRTCRVLHNGIDLTEWPVHEAGAARSPATILYSGSVFAYAQLGSLEDVRDLVRTLRADGRAVRLAIQTQHHGSPAHLRAFGAADGVELGDLVPPRDLRRSLASADVLLLPVSFDPVAVDFIRLSIPGKLAEYLASGTPVLYYGPPDVAQARFLAREGCALSVTTREPAALRAGIERLLTDLTLRRDLSARARRATERFFDIRRLRGELRSVVDGVLEAPAR